MNPRRPVSFVVMLFATIGYGHATPSLKSTLSAPRSAAVPSIATQSTSNATIARKSSISLSPYGSNISTSTNSGGTNMDSRISMLETEMSGLWAALDAISASGEPGEPGEKGDAGDMGPQG